MTSPIVEHLSDMSNNDDPGPATTEVRQALHEAAAEIERLSTELARARAERDRAALVAADEANRADAAEAALAERTKERDQTALHMRAWEDSARVNLHRAEEAERLLAVQIAGHRLSAKEGTANLIRATAAEARATALRAMEVKNNG